MVGELDRGRVRADGESPIEARWKILRESMLDAVVDLVLQLVEAARFYQHVLAELT